LSTDHAEVLEGEAMRSAEGSGLRDGEHLESKL
jgi:hypothetical protein